jgi:hypothetical protein
MMQRCYNSKNSGYKNYGGRGIKVCDRWHTFENFFEDMGKRPKGLTLDRKDNNGDYCLENCRWATAKEQMNNNRNNNWLTHEGETRNITQWAGIIGISRNTLGKRLNFYKWSIEKTLSASLGSK